MPRGAWPSRRGIATRWRRSPAAGLVLTAHPHQCLLLYPENAWVPIRDRILAAPSFDPRSAATKRVLLGNALDVTLDAAGRLLITPELREVAAFEKQVWLVGMGSHFEIWSDAGWKRQHEAAFEALVVDGAAARLRGLFFVSNGQPGAHVSVLLAEAVDALAIRADGVYVDGTFGRGGHSRAILEQLGPSGRLIALDRDPAAIAAGAAMLL